MLHALLQLSINWFSAEQFWLFFEKSPLQKMGIHHEFFGTFLFNKSRFCCKILRSTGSST
jgi:hypothetical protein